MENNNLLQGNTNAFAQKRVKTFDSLNTLPKDWIHAKIKSFKLKKVKNRKGDLIAHWIPLYQIPEGYTNPFDNDVLQSDWKRCQLCDTNIIRHGIILCEKTKQFLVVGLECYEVYETDDHKKLKLNIL